MSKSFYYHNEGTQMTNIVLSLIGFLVGGFVGAAFGAIQNAAALRHGKKQEAGKLRSSLAIMPGSLRRVAFLMIALVFVQLGMPMLFTGNIQWVVSAGVIFGYGCMLYLQFRRRVRIAYGIVSAQHGRG